MLAATNVQLQRLIALREYGFPLAEQREREGRLDLDRFMSYCGTVGCLLGWWTTTEYAIADGWTYPQGPQWNGHACPEKSVAYYFGSWDVYEELFMHQEVGGTLAERKERLDAMISALVSKLVSELTV